MQGSVHTGVHQVLRQAKVPEGTLREVKQKVAVGSRK